MKTMTWTVAYKQDSTTPQQEVVFYTEEAAKAKAWDIMNSGGVAMVVEGDEDIPGYASTNIPQGKKGGLEWHE